MNKDERELLGSLFKSAVNAVLPERCLAPHLPLMPEGRTVVVGAGKAAAAMARVVVDHYGETTSGLVVTRYGHGLGTSRIGHIDIIEAGHPIPDDAGALAASRILDLVRGCGPNDLVLCLLSGGGSALLAMPAAGISLDDKKNVTKSLIASGATINEINCVRKHLSAVKGGQLALAAHPAEVVTLAISDVAGDDPSVIASGPTLADPTTFADAWAILNKFNITPPRPVARHMDEALNETPKANNPSLKNTSLHIVASAKQALAAAAQSATERGLEPVMLGDKIQGEAREVARAHAALARKHKANGKAIVLLSGGETTVTIQGSGGGGPNTEYMLALAIELAGEENVYGIACDSDGIDGSEDNAGAMIFPDTLARANTLGLTPLDYLANNDSYGFFAPLQDLVMPGPTLTNVNDFRAILVTPH